MDTMLSLGSKLSLHENFILREVRNLQIVSEASATGSANTDLTLSFLEFLQPVTAMLARS